MARALEERRQWLIQEAEQAERDRVSAEAAVQAAKASLKSENDVRVGSREVCPSCAATVAREVHRVAWPRSAARHCEAPLCVLAARYSPYWTSSYAKGSAPCAASAPTGRMLQSPAALRRATTNAQLSGTPVHAVTQAVHMLVQDMQIDDVEGPSLEAMVEDRVGVGSGRPKRRQKTHAA